MSYIARPYYPISKGVKKKLSKCHRKKINRRFILHLYGHSHVRRFGEFLRNEPTYNRKKLPQLDACNAERRLRDPDCVLYRADLGFPHLELHVYAEEGRRFGGIANEIEQHRDEPRDIQLIYAGDNDRSTCPDPVDAADEVLRMVDKYMGLAPGPTIVAGLLPRWGDHAYCDWAGKVNARLQRDIARAWPDYKVIYLRHFSVLRHEGPQTPQQCWYPRHPVHGDQYLNGRQDNIHLGLHGNACFYAALQNTVVRALGKTPRRF